MTYFPQCSTACNHGVYMSIDRRMKTLPTGLIRFWNCHSWEICQILKFVFRGLWSKQKKSWYVQTHLRMDSFSLQKAKLWNSQTMASTLGIPIAEPRSANFPTNDNNFPQVWNFCARLLGKGKQKLVKWKNHVMENLLWHRTAQKVAMIREAICG